ncbi:MAG: hemolysin family protein [Myxococcota bacterium]|nr:hemolysin family protein [Myxococcota bacterium]
MPADLTLLLLVLVCLALSAFFSGSETALLRLAHHEVEEGVKEARGPAALAVRDLLSHTSRLLVTILLGNNLVNILAASSASALAIHHLGERNGIFTSTIVMTLVVLIFCEVLPKAVAARHPRKIAFTVGMPLYLLHQVLRPVHAAFDKVVEPIVRRVGAPPDEGTGPPIETVLRLARANQGAAKEGTPLAIIGATAGAAEMTVEEIMVPRTEIVAFPISTPPAELLERVMEERYTRVPVYEGTIDRVLGIVHLKDLVKLVREGGGDLNEIVKPVLRVPERKPILRLLQEMQSAFAHMALVKDEFGVTQGLCTQEDILEEIVGEIRDEFDREELQTIRAYPDGSYQALGRVKVLDFNRETGWEVPAERGDSLGGLVFNTLGHAPRQGDRVELGGFEMTVVGVSGSRITRVRVARLPSNGRDEE